MASFVFPREYCLSRDQIPPTSCIQNYPCFFYGSTHLSGRGEYGRHIREDVTSCNRDFLRGRIRIGLASKPNETTVSRLEKEASTGETHRNTEEIGSGLNGKITLLESYVRNAYLGLCQVTYILLLWCSTQVTKSVITSL